MSLRPTTLAPIPEDTARIARAAFPKGTLFMRMRDELGTLFQDERFAALYPELVPVFWTGGEERVLLV